MATTVAGQLWGGRLALIAPVVTGVSTVPAATAGFGCFSFGESAGFEVAAPLGAIGLVVSLFLGAEYRYWAEAIGSVLPAFVVLSLLPRRAVIRSNRAFDPEG
ncbi:hypothetical protein ACFYRL_14100 [Streptomyces goshikiensis]|uniref:hypothetical protein n=1 Tax=Streptomyces goshikiensis TaxID=1942 RepID=UPI0036B5DEF7